MLTKFKPNFYKPSIFEITPEFLQLHGIKGIITDLDNTLVEWDRVQATENVVEWFENMKEHGIQIAIVSNNNEERVRAFANPHGILFFHRAKKPSTIQFEKATESFRLKRGEVCVIGDQLLTDIFGGNRFGAHTILVQPVASTDGFWTKFNRKIEKMIFYFLRKQGNLTWEEK